MTNVPQVTNVHFFGNVGARHVNNNLLFAGGWCYGESEADKLSHLIFNKLLGDVDVDETRASNFNFLDKGLGHEVLNNFGRNVTRSYFRARCGEFFGECKSVVTLVVAEFGV